MENINLIIPMAGGGTRFKKEGIEMPKPLIDLNGKPFFFWAAQSIVKFLKVEKLIFIVLREHVEKHEIDKKILEYYPEAQLKVIDKVLNGAVLTCLEGVELIDNDNPILFNDCDHTFLSDSFYKYCLKKDFTNIDGALLTFTSNDEKYSYMSGIYNIMIKNKMKIKSFSTDLHISFGTPVEYEESKKYDLKQFL